MRQIAARLLLSFAAYLAATRCLWADILTAQYDSFRTSWNASEIYLNVGNVNQARFGKLFSRQLDGWVYAQPLYMQSLTIPGHGAVNVVFVCTANNTVYAFDADSASVSAPYTTGLPIWAQRTTPPTDLEAPTPSRSSASFPLR